MEYSFAPLADEKSRLLILGSLPGVKSLQAQQYYAHPQNRFWRIVFSVFGEEFSENYATRTALMLKNGAALWDVVRCAERKGSLDGNIKEQSPNDIPALLAGYPGIGLVLFNGAFAFNNYRRFFGEPTLPYKKLLSTSPACAGRDEERFAMWKEALTGHI